MRILGPALVGAAVVGTPAAGLATWSIAAVDPATREVGAAGATCNANVHERIPGLVPDVGALDSQAASYDPNRQLALQLMRDGNAPDQILAMVAAQDGQWQTRQMGIADLTLASAGHTGSQNSAWAGDLQAPGIAVQGNILTGPEVVDDAMAAMTATAPVCPYTLADRLMDAMEAARAQGGDSRCSGTGARSAFLLVARPGDPAKSPTVEIIVADYPDSMGPAMGDPIVALRMQYDAWRAANPADDSGCGGDETTSTGGGTGTGTPGDGGDGGDPDGGSGSGDSGGLTSSDSGNDAGETAITDAGGSDGGTTDDTGKGCGCASGTRGSLVGLLLLGLIGRRRI